MKAPLTGGKPLHPPVRRLPLTFFRPGIFAIEDTNGTTRIDADVTFDIERALQQQHRHKLFSQANALVEVVGDPGEEVVRGIQLDRLLSITEDVLTIVRQPDDQEAEEADAKPAEEPEEQTTEDGWPIRKGAGETDEDDSDGDGKKKKPKAKAKKKPAPAKTRRPWREDCAVVLNSAEKWAPRLERVIRCPYVTSEGEVVAGSGYDARTGLFHAHPDIDIKETTLEEAVKLILSILRAWNFMSEVDFAHALALFFLPFFRPAFESQTPLHIISAADAGGGKCVVGSTLVASPKGLVRIENGEGLTSVQGTVDADTLTTRPVAPAQWLSMGTSRTIKIRTHSGILLEGTPEHPLLIWRGKPMWIQLQHMQVGDHVLLWPGYGLDCGTRHIDDEEAYLVGLFMGNGCRGWAEETGLVGLRFSTSYPEIAQAYRSRAETFWGVLPQYKSNQGETVDWSINSREVAALVQAKFPGLVCGSARDKYVPPALMSATKQERVRFLQGLFDTDAGVADSFEWSSASERLAREVHQLLLSLGVVGQLRPKKAKGSANVEAHTYWRILVRGEHLRMFKDQIGFRSSTYKAEALAELCNRETNPNVGCYPHVDTLLKGLKPEWKTQGRWGGREGTLDGAHVRDYLKGARKPSKTKLLSMIEGCMSEEARLLRNLTQFYPDPIEEIAEGLSPVAVYDWHVLETHSFVANGIVSHNTALAEVIGAVGGKISTRGLDDWGSEASRQLLAAVAQEPDILFFDNVPPSAVSQKNSTDLLRIATSNEEVGIRPVGQGERRIKPRAIWIFTAIDLHKYLCREIARRSLLIRLAPGKMITPAFTEGRQLYHWVKDCRHVVRAAALTVVRAAFQGADPDIRETAEVAKTFRPWAGHVRRILATMDEVTAQLAQKSNAWQATSFSTSFLKEEAEGTDDTNLIELFREWPADDVGEMKWLAASEVSDLAAGLGIEEWTSSGKNSAALAKRLVQQAASHRVVRGLVLEVKKMPRNNIKVYRPTLAERPRTAPTQQNIVYLKQPEEAPLLQSDDNYDEAISMNDNEHP